METAVAIDHRVEIGVVERANHEFQGIAVEAVREARDLPCAEMAGEDEHPAAARPRRQIVLEPFGFDPALELIPAIARKEAELGELPPQMPVEAAQQTAALGFGLFGKSQGEVAAADGDEAAVSEIKGPGDGDACGARRRPRQGAQDGFRQPYRRVLEDMA